MTLKSREATLVMKNTIKKFVRALLLNCDVEFPVGWRRN